MVPKLQYYCCLHRYTLNRALFELSDEFTYLDIVVHDMNFCSKCSFLNRSYNSIFVVIAFKLKNVVYFQNGMWCI